MLDLGAAFFRAGLENCRGSSCCCRYSFIWTCCSRYRSRNNDLSWVAEEVRWSHQVIPDGYSSKIIVAEFPVTESRRLQSTMWEKFRSKDEIIKVRDRPRGHSVVEFRNMFIVLAVLAQIVRQLFGLVEWRSLIASPYISFDWVNCLETFNLIILPFLFFHFKVVCEFGQLFENYIWSTHSFLFIRLQDVRELGQLYEYISSDHPIPSRSSVSRTCVNLINCFEISHLIILSSTFVSWSYWTWLII